MACELLRKGDIAGAQGVQDAAGLNCPTGMVSTDRYTSRSGRVKKGGVYDDRGVLYDIPGWVVADPEDIVEDAADEEAESEEFMDEKVGALSGDAAADARSQEKGKQPAADIGQVVKARARLSGGEPDVVVTIGMDQKVGVLVDKIKAKTSAGRVKLAHMGKMLPENKKLSETAWTPDHVLNAFVFES